MKGYAEFSNFPFSHTLIWISFSRLFEQPLPELQRWHQHEVWAEEAHQGLHRQLLREDMPKRKWVFSRKTKSAWNGKYREYDGSVSSFFFFFHFCCRVREIDVCLLQQEKGGRRRGGNMIEWETIFLFPPLESGVPCDRDFPPLALNSDILYFASSQFFVGGSGKTGAAAALENKHTASFLPGRGEEQSILYRKSGTWSTRFFSRTCILFYFHPFRVTFVFELGEKGWVSMGKKGGNQINSLFPAAAAKVRPLPWESERVDIFMLFIEYIETGLFWHLGLY